MSFWISLRADISRNLRAKVILGVIIILITVMGVFTYWDMIGRVGFHLSREETKALEFSKMVRKSIEYPMLDGEMEDVQATLESLASMTDLAFVNLHDPMQVIRYSGHPDNIGMISGSEVPREALDTQTTVKELQEHEGKRVLHYAVPVLNERPCFKCHGREKEVLGVVTVGIPWGPVETRVAVLRNRQILLGIVSISIVGFFLIKWVSRSVTRPVVQLTGLANQVSRGNLEATVDDGKAVKCWEILNCEKTGCPAYGKVEACCWYIDGTLFAGGARGTFPEKIEQCRRCKVYKMHSGDEVVQLSDALCHMTGNLRAYSEELRRAHDFQQNLIRGSIDGIIATDNKGNIVIFNEGAERIFGYASEEVIRKRGVADLYPAGRAKNVEEALYGHGHGGPGKLMDYETAILNKGGKEIPVWLSASVIYENEQAVGAVGFFRDLSERKRLEKKVLESERLATIGQGVSYISHEIKNPLMVIGGFAQQVLRKLDQKEKNKEKLNIIIKEVARLEEFLSEVTDITKPSKPKKMMTGINGLVEEVSTFLQEELKTRHVIFQKSLDPEIPEIFADPKQMKQVLLNIMKNAVEAMPEGGRLSVRTQLQGGNAELRITDTGKGVTPEDLKTIFDPFVTTKPKGTGLGLAISRKIVEDHEGRISIETKPGDGTACSIILPVKCVT
ncbi:MAG: ATP-binding protein [Thermodesulfobacteriota bacterium]|nr:ATP-binding protein [Thermodesulfobacteriota bacterium]